MRWGGRGLTAETFVPSIVMGSSTATILLSAEAPTVLMPFENTLHVTVKLCCLPPPHKKMNQDGRDIPSDLPVLGILPHP